MFFTNTVNIVYYLYLKDNETLSSSALFDLYSEWYNKIKSHIREIIYTEILNEKNNIKYLKYYNVYKYILDIKQYNESITSVNYTRNINRITDVLPIIDIMQVNYNYTICPHKSLSSTKRSNITDDYGFWDLYDNTTTFSIIYDKYKSTHGYYFLPLLFGLFEFFKKVSLFNNDMELLIPLLILYDFKQKYTSSDENDKLFWETFKNQSLINEIRLINDRHRSNIRIKDNIYICILILLLSDITNETCMYYTKSSNAEFEFIQKNNFEYYNNHIFQHIPIINDYYLTIIKSLISNLYTNIGILPNILNRDHTTEYEDNSKCHKVIYKNNNKKYYINYLTQWFKTHNTYLENHDKCNFLLSSIFIYGESTRTLTGLYNFEYEVYGRINHSPISEQENNASNIFIVNANDNYNGKFILYKQILEVFFKDIEKKLHDYDINILFLLPEILKIYTIYFYLCYLKGTDTPSRKANNLYFTKFNIYLIKYFKDIYYEPFISIIDCYIYTNDLEFFTQKKKFIINDKTLISNIEKKYFTVKEYNYYDNGDGNLCSSVIEFYNICTTDYNLVFPKINKNTQESIDIIKVLLEQDFSIYLLLNFYFIKTNNIITGEYKYNNKNTLTYSNNILTYIEVTQNLIFLYKPKQVSIFLKYQFF